MELFGAKFTWSHVFIIFFIIAFLWLIGYIDMGKKIAEKEKQDTQRARIRGLPGQIANSLGYQARLFLNVDASTEDIAPSQAETDVGVVEKGNQAVLMAMQQTPDEAPKLFDQNVVFSRNLASKLRKQLNKKDLPIELKNAFLAIEKRLAIQLLYMKELLQNDPNNVLQQAQNKELVEVTVKNMGSKQLLGGGKVRIISAGNNNNTTLLQFEGLLPLAGPLRANTQENIVVYRDKGVFDYYDDEDVKLGKIVSLTVDESGEKVVSITIDERLDVVNTKLQVGNVVYWAKD